MVPPETMSEAAQVETHVLKNHEKKPNAESAAAVVVAGDGLAPGATFVETKAYKVEVSEARGCVWVPSKPCNNHYHRVEGHQQSRPPVHRQPGGYLGRASLPPHRPLHLSRSVRQICGCSMLVHHITLRGLY